MIDACFSGKAVHPNLSEKCAEARCGVAVRDLAGFVMTDFGDIFSVQQLNKRIASDNRAVAQVQLGFACSCPMGELFAQRFAGNIHGRSD